MVAAQTKNPRTHKAHTLFCESPLRSALRPAFCRSLPTAICLSVLLAACSDSPTPASGQPAPSTEQPVAQTTPQVQVTGGQSAGRQPDDNEPVTSEPVNNEPDNGQETEVSPVATITLPDDHEHPSNSSSHVTRYTDSEQDIWPPQPKDITEVVALVVDSNSAVDVAKQQKSMRTIKSDQTITDLLGERHEVLIQRTSSNKSANTKSDLADNTSANLKANAIEFFNYDSNKVITVELAADGQSVIRHTEKDAHFYQPPESQEEVKRAIKLAAVALNQQGFTRHNDLTGTGLLAYPNAAQSAANGFNFFNERKIYVTFGTGNGELPEFRALVNLSTSKVESSGAIQ